MLTIVLLVMIQNTIVLALPLPHRPLFPGFYMSRLFSQLAEVKKQTVFFVQTAEVWSTSSAADVCRCGPQTADILHLKKQTAPK
ncbi:hypothetical protein HanHA300_Chr09g0319761 [Helianthus annuus]|nr:hypothetical protein HanHA300_Chr09g0319761 [Helianthus annuus]KAJ0542513.1 hypothetical protein HanHA89_Chr09g0340641 [Helianthus annuus]KAJ0707565.1 hypothetical protein HanLR1_Chr09g0319921 [Helianthus annuus]